MPQKKKTQEAAKEAMKEVKAKAQPKLVVYAPFELFEAGDAFEIPEGWVRDMAVEQLHVNKQKKRQGMAFRTPKGSSVILPVKEA